MHFSRGVKLALHYGMEGPGENTVAANCAVSRGQPTYMSRLPLPGGLPAPRREVWHACLRISLLIYAGRHNGSRDWR